MPLKVVGDVGGAGRPFAGAGSSSGSSSGSGSGSGVGAGAGVSATAGVSAVPPLPHAESANSAMTRDSDITSSKIFLIFSNLLCVFIFVLFRGSGK